MDLYAGRSRRQYLLDLADEYDVPRQTVLMLAALLGPSEDFDGLVTEVQDLAERAGLEF